MLYLEVKTPVPFIGFQQLFLTDQRQHTVEYIRLKMAEFNKTIIMCTKVFINHIIFK